MDVLPIGIMHHCDGKYDVESDVSSHNIILHGTPMASVSRRYSKMSY